MRKLSGFIYPHIKIGIRRISLWQGEQSERAPHYQSIGDTESIIAQRYLYSGADYGNIDARRAHFEQQ